MNHQPESFELKIVMGNAAMQTPADVAEALYQLARGLETWDVWPELISDGFVKDANGNRVGTWIA